MTRSSLKLVILGLTAFCGGWLMYPIGTYIWGWLLSTIAWPESRWGVENSRLIGEALQPIAYGILVILVSLTIAFSTKNFAVRYSLLMSLGTLMNFVVLWLWFFKDLLAAVHALSVEALFFVILLPLATTFWKWKISASKVSVV